MNKVFFSTFFLTIWDIIFLHIPVSARIWEKKKKVKTVLYISFSHTLTSVCLDVCVWAQSGQNLLFETKILLHNTIRKEEKATLQSKRMEVLWSVGAVINWDVGMHQWNLLICFGLMWFIWSALIMKMSLNSWCIGTAHYGRACPNLTSQKRSERKHIRRYFPPEKIPRLIFPLLFSRSRVSCLH